MRLFLLVKYIEWVNFTLFPLFSVEIIVQLAPTLLRGNITCTSSEETVATQERSNEEYVFLFYTRSHAPAWERNMYSVATP